MKRMAPLVVGVLLGCAPSPPAPASPTASPTKPAPVVPTEALTATSIRMHVEDPVCGSSRPTAFEGVTNTGDVAWRHVLGTYDVTTLLGDGTAIVHENYFEHPVTYRVLIDGSIPWSFRWPDAQPKPSSFSYLTFTELELGFWFNVGDGYDVWMFGVDGVQRGRVHHRFEAAMVENGQNALYVSNEHSVQIVGLDGKLRGRIIASGLSALPDVGSRGISVTRMADGHDALVGDDKVTLVDHSAQVVSTFSWQPGLGDAHGPSWGGLAVTTRQCELLMVQDGELLWKADVRGAGAPPCSDGYLFASSSNTLLVRSPTTKDAPSILFAFDRDGRRLFQHEIDSNLRPVAESDRLALRDCSKPRAEPLAEFPAPSPVAAAPVWTTLEATLERVLGVPVDALVVSDTNDVSALSGGHLWRFDGKRWRDTGTLRSEARAQKQEGYTFEPFKPGHLFGGAGQLWVTLRSAAGIENDPYSLMGYHDTVAQARGNTFSESAALRPAFERELSESSQSPIPNTHVLPGRDQTLVCHDSWCAWLKDGKAQPIKMPKDWATADVAYIDGAAWVLGPRLVRIDNDEGVVVSLAGVDAASPLRPRLWGASKNDVWWLEDKLYRRPHHHHRRRGSSRGAA